MLIQVFYYSMVRFYSCMVSVLFLYGKINEERIEKEKLTIPGTSYF